MMVYKITPIQEASVTVWEAPNFLLAKGGKNVNFGIHVPSLNKTMSELKPSKIFLPINYEDYFRHLKRLIKKLNFFYSVRF